MPDATQCLRFGVRCTHRVLNFQLRRQITYTLDKVKEVNKKSKNAKKLAPYDIYLAAPDYPTKSVPDSQESVEGVQGELSLVITCVIHAFITTAATTTPYRYHPLQLPPSTATALYCYHSSLPPLVLTLPLLLALSRADRRVCASARYHHPQHHHYQQRHYQQHH